MCLPLWSSLPPLYVTATKAKPTYPSKVQYREKIRTADGLGPCSDHQWSPRRLHVPACCMVGGMDWTKHNNAGWMRGPFDELSCSSHYKDSIHASFSTVLYSLTPNLLYHKQTLDISPFLIQLLTWPSTGHRPDSHLSPHILNATLKVVIWEHSVCEVLCLTGSLRWATPAAPCSTVKSTSRFSSSTEGPTLLQATKTQLWII